VRSIYIYTYTYIYIYIHGACAELVVARLVEEVLADVLAEVLAVTSLFLARLRFCVHSCIDRDAV